MFSGREFQRVGYDLEKARAARTLEIQEIEKRFWSHARSMPVNDVRQIL